MTTTDSRRTGRANVQAIYSLLPLQEALLLRGSADGRDDPGFIQVRFVLRGPLDVDAFERSWNEVARRHDALRMSCRSSEQAGPKVIVWKEVEVPFTFHDATGLDDASTESRIQTLVSSDRESGIDVSDAPAHRVAVVQTAADRCEVVWSCHHLFVDGWSTTLVLDDLLAIYRSYAAGQPMPNPPANDLFRRYYQWITTVEPDESREFWVERLDGYHPTVTLAAASNRAGFAVAEQPFPAELRSEVLSAAAKLKVTPNSLLQAAWALTLSRIGSSGDVVFGATVAGRAAPVDGIESLVGFLSNVVPVRARVTDEPAGDWLRRLRNDQFESQPHEHVFLSDIHRWSGVPGQVPLFDTLLVVENFPAMSGGATNGREDDLTFDEFRSGVTTAYPLSLAVSLGESWAMSCTVDQSYASLGQARAVMETFCGALRELVDSADRTVVSIRDALPDPGIAVAPATPATPAARRREHVPPGDRVELLIAEAWAHTLGIDGPGIDDDFFEVGGTSLLGVQLMTQIHLRLGTRLPLAALLDSPSIRRLAAVARENVPVVDGCLVPIRSEGSKRPLYCIHAAHLHVLFYRDLARRLGADQPVYGIEPVGRNGERPPLETIEEMAAAYVEEIRAIQPTGPYRLLGYCLGGIIGLEMSRQFEVLGEEVELLAVVDAQFPPRRDRTTPVMTARTLLETRGLRYLASRVGSRLAVRLRRWREARSDSIEQAVATDWVTEASRRALRSYEPAPSKAAVTLFRSREFVELWPDPVRWRAVAPRVDVHEVDAEHYDMLLEPRVEQIAATLRPILERP